MLFDVYLTMRGPAGTVEAPSRGNPVECADLASLLAHLAGNLPHTPALGLECVGVRVAPRPADGGRTP